MPEVVEAHTRQRAERVVLCISVASFAMVALVADRGEDAFEPACDVRAVERLAALSREHEAVVVPLLTQPEPFLVLARAVATEGLDHDGRQRDRAPTFRGLG